MAKKQAYFEHTLIDAWMSHREAPGWCLDATELGLGARGDPYWSLSFDTLHGGRQEGVDVLEVDNGRFAFTVVPSRGMGIQEAHCDEVRLGWESPVGELVHPAYVPLWADGGTGWLEGFSEWLVRCGLRSNGAAYEGGTLHGRIANLPASAVSVRVQLDAPHTITVSGVVHEVRVAFHSLLLETEIETEPGANWIRVRDRVTNLGGRSTDMQMLYHVNCGPPLLEEGARFVAPVDWLAPREAGYDKDRLRGWDRYAAPIPGFWEECFYMKLRADRRGQVTEVLHNANRDLALVQTHPLEALPCFTLWKKPGALADGYVTGLEPATNYPNPHPFEKEQGRVVRLRSRQTWSNDLRFEVVQGRKAVDAAVRRARGGRRGRPRVYQVPQPGVSPEAV